MNKIRVSIVLLCSLLIFSCTANRTFSPEKVTLIPKVNSLNWGTDWFEFNKKTSILVENNEQAEMTKQFVELFKRAAGFEPALKIGEKSGTNQVIFITDKTLGQEAYTLNVTSNRIEIKASGLPGFFYGLQTLRQLLPNEIEKKEVQRNVDWAVRTVTIADQPVFAWRGYMLDVSRHFIPKSEVLNMIDYLSLHKINTLHLHLVDDQGWRIEIKKYPELTKVGAWRVDHEDKNWNARPKQQPGEKATYGGFYTQEDIKEMVAFAKTRNITIVPEIEMPAHVSSALSAYPQFSCKGTPLTVPSGGVWPITDIYCAGNDSTFAFIEEVLTEVMDLFPSKYIHIGGDEATKTEWEKCPKCQKRIKAEKLKNVGELQSYFIKRIEKFINSKDRVLLGWDEILEGGLPPKATVMSWRGMQGGIEAAHQGHDVVMTPGTPCYFDHYQGPLDQEPLAIGGYNPISRVYEFNPIPEELKGEAAKHILGAQANLWTEYVPNAKHAQYMTFPRIAALAEVLWTSKELRSWPDFAERIQLMMNRYDIMGINYAKSGFKVSAKSTADTLNAKLSVVLKAELGGDQIHFTTDGSEPTPGAAKYEKPVLVEKTTTLKAATFIGGKQISSTLTQSFDINKLTSCKVNYLIPFSKYYKGSGNYTLVNGIKGSLNNGDGEWQAWNGNDMQVVVELKNPAELSEVRFGSLQNPGSWIFLPSKAEIEISSDGKTYTKVGEVKNTLDPMASTVERHEFSIKFPTTKGAYLKITIKNLGKCPKGHSGEGKPAWLFVDELSAI